jgi:hypothetical protein
MTGKGSVGREGRRGKVGGDFEPENLGGKLSRARILRSPGIDSQPIGPVRQPYLTSKILETSI